MIGFQIIINYTKPVLHCTCIATSFSSLQLSSEAPEQLLSESGLIYDRLENDNDTIELLKWHELKRVQTYLWKCEKVIMITMGDKLCLYKNIYYSLF